MTSTPRRLDRRPARSVPVTLLALLLIAIGGVGAWLLGSLLIDGAMPSSAAGSLDQVGGLRMDATPVLVTAGVLAALGIVLLLCAIVPGRSSRRRVLDGDVPGQTAVSHRDLARRVRLRIERVDGVQSAQVDVGRSKVDVRARTVVDDVDRVLQGCRTAADQAVDELRPSKTLRTRVRVQQMN